MNRKLLISGAFVSAFALGFLILPRAAFALESATGTPLLQSGTDKENAGRMAASLNATRYNGWFSDPAHNINDVMAVWAIESNYKPDALNRNDGGTGNHAYGIGQVLASTAGDFGVTNPVFMLDLQEGARVSMDYMKWSHDYLEARMGRAPTKSEWIGSYNAGVGAVLQGRLPAAYLAKFFAKNLTSVLGF